MRESRNRPVAAAQRRERISKPLACAQLFANRLAAAGQRELAAAINGSPVVTAQRKSLSLMFAGAAGPVVQRINVGGRRVEQDNAYPNANQAAILQHARGEWANNRGGGAVGGGHLLTGMVAEWGPAVANSPNPNRGSHAGVHFEGALPGGNITPHQHKFRLVKDGVVSGEKGSTFWPADWNEDALVGTLRNSWQNGADNLWASKQNMTYWYRWQTLGQNTAFPTLKQATAQGTARNKMRRGRQPQ